MPRNARINDQLNIDATVGNEADKENLMTIETIDGISDIDPAEFEQTNDALMLEDATESAAMLRVTEELADSIKDNSDLIMAQRQLIHARSESHAKRSEQIWEEYCNYTREKYGANVDPLARTAETPQQVLRYLYIQCDFPDSTNDEGQLVGCKGLSYSTAENIRAAISNKFGDEYNCNSLRYFQDAAGNWQGNPSLSNEVTKYMKSLKKRKNAAGEVPVSMKAIMKEDLKNIWDRMMALRDPTDRMIASRNYCIYILSFLCLLRLDEALNITLGDIEWMPRQKNGFKLTLRWRKTSQDGDVDPFYLYRNDRYRHLCPVRALLNWVYALDNQDSPITRKSPLFRKISGFGRVDPKQSLEIRAFRTQLASDIALVPGMNPRSYGGHSFRRGGCQYFHCYREPKSKRWDLKKLCNWGGWSVDFDNVTIVRYLLGRHDQQYCHREHYMEVELAEEEE
ncbi:hypothetical protein MP228_003794 [Amoeboaphelidium protococcarum]|nr:hypothetical protein MP228_004035 [Amoeboaphelidium protococcarum]KAI3651044.1 hypothetical protein MP228_004525 [Amoeboaphelidium protococcarum]KAI3651348.1 hypothetical protein MP228_003794 [Amoeboaphelidium protococcarum]